jgi:hypothetical protein
MEKQKSKKQEPLTTTLANLTELKRNNSITAISDVPTKTESDNKIVNDGTIYKLEGCYNYEEVIALNKLTTVQCGEKKFKRYCKFAYCQEIGNIAFIGIIRSKFGAQSGHFDNTMSPDSSTLYFELYSNEAAKKATNYTVYVIDGAEKVSSEVTILPAGRNIHFI